MIKSTARRAYDALMTLTDDNDDAQMILRSALIDSETPLSDLYDADQMIDAPAILRLLELISPDRELMTQLALNDSLCPLHFIDYAICFDDDDAECAAIRTIHPSHDT